MKQSKKLFITFCLGVGLDMFTLTYCKHWLTPIELHERK